MPAMLGARSLRPAEAPHSSAFSLWVGSVIVGTEFRRPTASGVRGADRPQNTLHVVLPRSRAAAVRVSDGPGDVSPEPEACDDFTRFSLDERKRSPYLSLVL